MRLALVSLLALVLVGACDGDGDVDGPSNTTLSVVTGSVDRGSEVVRIDYTLRSTGSPPLLGTLDLSAFRWDDEPGTLDEGELKHVWRRSLLLPTDAYAVELVGRNEIGEVICRDETAFETATDLPADVYRVMSCAAPVDPRGDAILTVVSPEGSEGDDPIAFFADIWCGEDLNNSDTFYTIFLAPAGDTPNLVAREATADLGSGSVQTSVWGGRLFELPAGNCRVDIERRPLSSDRGCTAEVNFTVVAGAVTPVTFVLPCAD